MSDKIWMAVLIVCTLLFGFAMFAMLVDCDRKGGTLVRTFYNSVECVKLERAE